MLAAEPFARTRTRTKRGRALALQQAASSGGSLRALEAFTQAYEVLPRPAILMNVAGAQVQTGRVVAGVASYKKVLASGFRTSSARGRAGPRRGRSEARARACRRYRADVERPDLPRRRARRRRRRCPRPGRAPRASPYDRPWTRRTRPSPSSPGAARRRALRAAREAGHITAHDGDCWLVSPSSPSARPRSWASRGSRTLSDLRDGCGVASRCAPSDVDAANTKLLASDIALGVGIVTAAVAGYLWFSHGRRRISRSRRLAVRLRW